MCIVAFTTIAKRRVQFDIVAKRAARADSFDWDKLVSQGYKGGKKAFKEDALRVTGLADHPKRNRIFNHAWNREFYREGYTGVLAFIEEIAGLVK